MYCFKLIIFNLKLFDCLVSHIAYCVSFVWCRTTLLTSCLQSVNIILGHYTYAISKTFIYKLVRKHYTFLESSNPVCSKSNDWRAKIVPSIFSKVYLKDSWIGKRQLIWSWCTSSAHLPGFEMKSKLSDTHNFLLMPLMNIYSWSW
jgi:hypothetical protein